MPRKKGTNRRPPPCPDPDLYHWVEGDTGGYWRRNKKTSVVNSSLRSNNKAMKQISPFSRLLRECLADFTVDLVMGRLGNRINRAMFRSLQHSGKLQPEYLKGLDFQKDHPLTGLVNTGFQTTQDKGQKRFTVTLPLTRNYTIKKVSSLLTGYQFTAILLYQPNGSGTSPKLISTGSPVYRFTDSDIDCTLQLQLQAKPRWWLLLLRAECYEGTISALHHRHKAMSVIGGGGTIT